MGERGGETTRLFAAGQLRFVVATTDPQDRILLESLFEDLPSPAPEVGDEIELFAFLRETHDGKPQWRVSGPRVFEGEPAVHIGDALTRVMTGLNVAALDAAPSRLHLHAGAVVRDGRSIVIAAERNTGKTTTVANLLQRGWAFLTDETVALTDDDQLVRGFPKPLSIKPGGHLHVEHLQHALVPPLDDQPGFRFVSASGAGYAVAEPAEPHVVVLLSRDRFADTPAAGYTSIHPADAVVKLMQETLDAGRYGPAALRLAHLASRAHCVQVSAGSPPDTAALIADLAEQPPRSPVAVTELPASPAFSGQVTTIRIDDRAVVHDQESGRIFAFDPMGTQVWEKLAGWAEHDSIDLAGPGVAPLVEQLRGLGVLAAGAQ